MAATVAGSVTRATSPPTARSNSRADTLSVQRGSRARFRPLRVSRPVSNHQKPSAHSAPMPVTCGLPSGLIVASQQVCRSGPPVPGAWLRPASSRASMRSQSSLCRPQGRGITPEGPGVGTEECGEEVSPCWDGFSSKQAARPGRPVRAHRDSDHSARAAERQRLLIAAALACAAARRLDRRARRHAALALPPAARPGLVGFDGVLFLAARPPPRRPGGTAILILCLVVLTTALLRCVTRRHAGLGAPASRAPALRWRWWSSCAGGCWR